MNLKKLLIVILLIFLTGCSSEYTLKVNNNSFKENIDIVIPKSMIPTLTEDQNQNKFELDDQITPFIEEKTAALKSQEKFYKKKVLEDDEYYQIKMNYTFDENEFVQANSINSCFQYPDLDFSENYYINLQGEFYCLYSESVDIKIETNNKVYFNNADLVEGNTYIWHIDNSNVDYVDIRIEIGKGISISTVITIISIVSLIVFITLVVYKFYKKRKEENSI